MSTKRNSQGWNAPDVEYVPIRVTSNVLLHIGAGIYQSVAGALKELVSNAFDADAKSVVITTGMPEFSRFKIVDNGVGMSVDDFKRAIQQIGTSLKGALSDSRATDDGRPMIGRLGIGLMALTQICSRARIESQQRGGSTKFVAELDFTQFKQRPHDELMLDVMSQDMLGPAQIEKLLDQGGLDIESEDELRGRLVRAKEAAARLKTITNDPPDREHLGYCIVYPNLPAPKHSFGTTVILDAIEPGVVNALTDHGRSRDAIPAYYRTREGYSWADYRAQVNSYSWEELCHRLAAGTSGIGFHTLPKYHQFLWELGIQTPVQYLPNAPVIFDKNVLKDEKERLASYDFRLIVDKYELRRPVLLPAGPLKANVELMAEYDYVIEPLAFDEEVAGERLQLHGYIYWQRKQIQPGAMRGVQIYIRNVGIGLFDKSLLNFFTVNPTSRAGQICAEVYVTHGLERALNVDRNSFRETDPHYVALQEYVWKVLGSAAKGDGVIGKSIDAYWRRKRNAESQDEIKHRSALKQLVGHLTNRRIDVKFTKDQGDAPFEMHGRTLVVHTNSSAWPRSTVDRRIVQRVLVPLRAALANNRSKVDVHELILEILDDL